MSGLLAPQNVSGEGSDYYTILWPGGKPYNIIHSITRHFQFSESQE